MCLIRGSHEIMRTKFPTMEDIRKGHTQPISFDFGLWKRYYKVDEEKNENGQVENSLSNVQVFTPHAGDILIVDHSTLFGFGANLTSERWRSLAFNLVPEGSTFAGVRNTWISKYLLEKTPPGSILTDENNFPLVHSELE